MKFATTTLATLALGLSISACAHHARETAPAGTNMTTRAVTDVDTTQASNGQRVEVQEECKQVVTCYTALARDLCLEQDDSCRSAFEVTTPVGNEKVCKQLLEEAKTKAKPYMAQKKKYHMPDECG